MAFTPAELARHVKTVFNDEWKIIEAGLPADQSSNFGDLRDAAHKRITAGLQKGGYLRNGSTAPHQTILPSEANLREAIRIAHHKPTEHLLPDYDFVQGERIGQILEKGGASLPPVGVIPAPPAPKPTAPPPKPTGTAKTGYASFMELAQANHAKVHGNDTLRDCFQNTFAGNAHTGGWKAVGTTCHFPTFHLEPAQIAQLETALKQGGFTVQRGGSGHYLSNAFVVSHPSGKAVDASTVHNYLQDHFNQPEAGRTAHAQAHAAALGGNAKPAAPVPPPAPPTPPPAGTNATTPQPAAPDASAAPKPPAPTGAPPDPKATTPPPADPTAAAPQPKAPTPPPAPKPAAPAGPAGGVTAANLDGHMAQLRKTHVLPHMPKGTGTAPVSLAQLRSADLLKEVEAAVKKHLRGGHALHPDTLSKLASEYIGAHKDYIHNTKAPRPTLAGGDTHLFDRLSALHGEHTADAAHFQALQNKVAKTQHKHFKDLTALEKQARLEFFDHAHTTADMKTQLLDQHEVKRPGFFDRTTQRYGGGRSGFINMPGHDIQTHYDGSVTRHVGDKAHFLQQGWDHGNVMSGIEEQARMRAALARNRATLAMTGGGLPTFTPLPPEVAHGPGHVVPTQTVAKTEQSAVKAASTLGKFGKGLAITGVAGVGLLGLAAALRSPARAAERYSSPIDNTPYVDPTPPMAFTNSSVDLGGFAMPPMEQQQQLGNWAARMQQDPMGTGMRR